MRDEVIRAMFSRGGTEFQGASYQKAKLEGWIMFERFTERARHSVTLAQETAREVLQAEVLPVHLLVGLVREEEGLAARALASVGVTDSQVTELLSQGRHGSPGGQLPFAAASKKVLERALRHALQLGHNYIGTEHILLAVVESDSVASTLKMMNTTPMVVEAQVMKLLSGRASGDTRKAAPEPEITLESVRDKTLAVVIDVLRMSADSIERKLK